MVQYIEHIFQQFINVKVVAIVRCVGKKWLPEKSGQAFWFCEGSASRWSVTSRADGAKANPATSGQVVPIVRLAKN
ncbi:MAG: hypothetical protein IPM48_07455 [Saprospiraceae bacterium]|nr:hypothetical protein [Saprospiraceae bacterium]